MQTVLDRSGTKELLVCGAMTQHVHRHHGACRYDLGYGIRLVGHACATRDLEFEGGQLAADVVHRSFLSALEGTFCEVIKTVNVTR